MHDESRDTFERSGLYLTPRIYLDSTCGRHAIQIGALLDGPFGGYRDALEYECALADGPCSLVAFASVYAGDVQGPQGMRALEEFVRLCFEHHPRYVAS